ncbi:hypothetical protein BB560_000201 [Smittium megazygosporum]|uniref:Ketoreductase (KR) domain-containing protein n=1 Tax=Smittium megazygosporum TaxID=133381 RepID=A0A2T9ZL47_9FUNG|nr:hypothetical protein BB560_000201 [Smittium megazygosporum]
MAEKIPTVIVTGASKGIGRAACIKLLEAGANVVGFARSQNELQSLQDECAGSATKGRFVYVAGDITDRAACSQVVEKAVSEFKSIDALVNNAAIIDPLKKLSEVSKEEMHHHLDVNLYSVLELTQLALPYLNQTHGRVINVSSGSAINPLIAWGPYCVSKAALNMLTANIALEEPNVTFLALRPGVVDTELQHIIRTSGEKNMSPKDHEKFVGLKTGSKLLSASVPGQVICNLALRLDHSMTGKFFSWDSPELESYRS